MEGCVRQAQLIMTFILSLSLFCRLPVILAANGAAGGSRTHDARIKSALPYH